MRPFKLALAQMAVHGGRREENLRRATDHIAAAARAGAELVLLPEALDCGWCHPSALTEAGTLPDGDACRRLREAAQAHGLHVCAGLVEREQDRLFNSAVLISPEGEVLLHHRKINELSLAHHLYACGDRLAVAHTPLGTLGLMICADGFVPGQTLSRSLALMGAELILSPCAWAVPPDHDNQRDPYGGLWQHHYGIVAREAGLWIAGVSNVAPILEGDWAGHRCIGCSLVVNAVGEPVLRGPYEEEALLLVEVEPGTPLRRSDGTAEDPRGIDSD